MISTFGGPDLPPPSLFQREREFFNYRIRKYLARYPLDLSLSLIAANSIQRQDKILALPNVCYALVIHLLKGTLNGLSLRIQYRLLESDGNVSFHFRRAPLSRCSETRGPSDYSVIPGVLWAQRRTTSDPPA